MNETKRAKIFAGLSTGVKLEQYARSILKQVQAMDSPLKFGSEWSADERVHIGVEPMLLALSMEFALKAWYAWDHDKHEPIRTHNLTKLYGALKDTSKQRLDKRFRTEVAPIYPNFFCTDYSIEIVFTQHADAFVEWRYMHEEREGGMSFDYSTFTATLELVLDEFGTLYETRQISPQRTVR